MYLSILFLMLLIVFIIIANLILCILQIVTESISGQEDDTLLKAFLELEESTPKLLRPYMENVLTLAIGVSIISHCFYFFFFFFFPLPH